MKKASLMLAAVAGIGLMLAGCDMQIRDKWTAPAVKSVYVGFGGENTFNITKVTLDGVEKTDLESSSFAPSAWNAVSEFKTLTLTSGSTAVYTFKQPTQGSGAWNSWSLAFWDSNAQGNFLRGDNYLNASADITTWTGGGKWCAGGAIANGTWSNGYTYLTCASTLPTDATVTLTITFDGTNVTVVEAVNGTQAYTTTSSAWK